MLFLFTIATALGTMASVDDSVIYISATNGSDNNDGKSPSTALQTLAAGLTKCRRLQAQKMLLEGTFKLSEPLTINMPGLIIDQWPDKPKPVISGSFQIPPDTWSKVQGQPGVWQAKVSPQVAAILQDTAAIYVAGQRREVVRTATLRWNRSLSTPHSAANKWGFVYSPGDIPASWALDKASVGLWRVAAFHSWNKAYHHVGGIFPENRTIRFVGPAQFGYGDYEYCSLQRWYIENVPELPLSPGSWKTSANALYYAPTQGEKAFPSSPVEVPMLSQLVRVYSSNVRLYNLVLQHTTGVPHCGASSAPRSACDADLAEMSDGALLVGGNTHGVQVVNLTARDVGGYGLKANNAADLLVDRSLFTRCGAGGCLLNGSPRATVRNSFVVGFGMRYPAGVGVVMGNCPNGTVTHNDVSGGLYNGIVYGGVNDAGKGTTISFNHVHGNGHESDDGICDFGAIHGSNPGSLHPIFITSNVLHNITAFQNGGNGVYMDAGSVALVVQRNLIYDVAGAGLIWNGDMRGRPAPTPKNSGPTRVLNNVVICERDNLYSRRFLAQNQGSRNPVFKWDGYTPAQMDRNVFVVDAGRAPSRRAWFNGKPCAANRGPHPGCTWDLADSFRPTPGVAEVAAKNIYFNATPGSQQLTHTFPGACKATPLGACSATRGQRSDYNHGCACASLGQWQGTGEDGGSLSVDPELKGSLRLVTSPVALGLGIEPLDELSDVGPDWMLPPS